MTVAGVFGLPHLSEDAVAAFADGVLSGSAAVRARRHCAECVECAEAVRAQRETALLLRAASSPSVPADLLSRLASVPMSATLPPPRGGLPTVLGADGVPMFVAHDARNAVPQRPRSPFQPSPPTRQSPGRQSPAQLPPDRQQPGQQHSHRRVLLPVGILASAAAVVAAGAIGSQPSSLPKPVEQQPASVQQLSTNLTGGQRSGTPASGTSASGAPASGMPSLDSGRLDSQQTDSVFGARRSNRGRSALRAVQSRPIGSVLPASAQPGTR